MIRGTPGPPDQKVYNRIFFSHGSTNPRESRNAFREAAHIVPPVPVTVHVQLTANHELILSGARMYILGTFFSVAAHFFAEGYGPKKPHEGSNWMILKGIEL